MLDRDQLKKIGFDYVIEKLSPWSPLGEDKKRRIAPFGAGEREQLVSELRNVRLLADEYSKDPEAFGPVAIGLMQLKDIRRSVARSRETTLTDIELFELKRFLIVLSSFAPAVNALNSAKELHGIDIKPLDGALGILDPDGQRTMTFRIPDGSSDELLRIRRERRQVDIALREANAPGGDAAEREELSIRRTDLAALEENELKRLRTIMTRELAAYSEELENVLGSIARFDLALAKARLMLELSGIVPEFADPCEEDAGIELVNMIDPRLSEALSEKGRSFTPVSISLRRGATVITGANMGGKSVAVKAIALMCRLAMCAMPVFAERMRLPVIPDIWLLAEDAEDSLGGLSSFGGEMVRFDRIIRQSAGRKNSLVLLDEFARGTNPHEGAGLVRAAVRYFIENGCSFAVITTHFDDVACLAPAHYQVMGFKNVNEAELAAALEGAAQGEADENGEKRRELLARFMDYGLFPAAGDENPPRDALKICRALGISESFMRLVDE